MPSELLKLTTKDELRYELLRRIKEEKYRYYVPNGKVEEFIKMVGENKYFVNLFLAANGVGKTCSLANIMANIFFSNHNKYFNYPLYTEWPYKECRARIISDPTTIQSALIPELKKWFPVGRYATTRNKKNFESFWQTSTGWTIDVMSYDQDPKEFESATLDLAYFDEPPPKQIFIATVARMRRGGIIIMGMTPLFHSAWVKDELVDKSVLEGTRLSVGIVTADVESACEEHGMRGHLKHADIEKMVSMYSEEEKFARIEGKFGHLLGLVYNEIEEDFHYVEPFEIPRNWNSVIAIDPHNSVPTAVSFVAISPDNKKYVVDELFVGGKQSGVVISDIASAIASKCEELFGKRKPDLAIIDPYACTPDPIGGNTVQLEYQRIWKSLGIQGFPLVKGSKDRDRGIALTHKHLKKYDDMMGNPTCDLFFFNKCRWHKHNFSRYSWDAYRGKIKDDKESTYDGIEVSAKNEVKKRDDHFPENIHRILIAFPYYRGHALVKPRDKRYSRYRTVNY